MYEYVSLTSAMRFSLPNRKAAAPAAAEYSRASPGAPCEVSAPTARPYVIRPDSTSHRQTNMASEPALQANSKLAE